MYVSHKPIIISYNWSSVGLANQYLMVSTKSTSITNRNIMINCAVNVFMLTKYSRLSLYVSCLLCLCLHPITSFTLTNYWFGTGFTWYIRAMMDQGLTFNIELFEILTFNIVYEILPFTLEVCLIGFEIMILAFLKFWHLTLGILKFWPYGFWNFDFCHMTPFIRALK